MWYVDNTHTFLDPILVFKAALWTSCRGGVTGAGLSCREEGNRTCVHKLSS